MPSVQHALWGSPATYPTTAEVEKSPTRTRSRRQLQPGDTAPSRSRGDCAWCWDAQISAQEHGTAMPRRRPVAYRVGTSTGERLACEHHAHQVAAGGGR